MSFLHSYYTVFIETASTSSGRWIGRYLEVAGRFLLKNIYMKYSLMQYSELHDCDKIISDTNQLFLALNEYVFCHEIYAVRSPGPSWDLYDNPPVRSDLK